MNLPPARAAEPRGVSQATAWVISCEHASHDIPPAWQPLFPDAELLTSHRGWDPGAAGLARYLGRALRAPVHLGRVSRLLADANRSASHPEVHAEVIRVLPPSDRQAILQAWHKPYQDGVAAAVSTALDGAQRVIHIACHSFTPVLHGRIRTADIGLLYDPRHGDEARFAQRWQRALQRTSTLRVRRNYPYRGNADGMTRILRRRFGSRLLGFELEINQALLQRGECSEQLCETLLATLREAAEAA